MSLQRRGVVGIGRCAGRREGSGQSGRQNYPFTQTTPGNRQGREEARKLYSLSRPREAAMHKFLHQQKIERFRRHLTNALDDRQREVLRTLLAEEEAKALADEARAAGADNPTD